MKRMLITVLAILTATIAHADIQWLWINGGTGTEQGTFVTTGEYSAEVPDGSYTVLDYSITASAYGAILGSHSGGEYIIHQPDIGFLWENGAPTQFWRSSGLFTNGLTLYTAEPQPPEIPSAFSFNIDYFVVGTGEGRNIFLYEEITPIITPVGVAVEEMSLGQFKALY